MEEKRERRPLEDLPAAFAIIALFFSIARSDNAPAPQTARVNLRIRVFSALGRSAPVSREREREGGEPSLFFYFFVNRDILISRAVISFVRRGERKVLHARARVGRMETIFTWMSFSLLWLS